jgi:hypothetical protein
MSASGFAELISGNVEPTERDPTAGISTIKDIFMNFDTKLKSPDFILPAKKEYNKQDMINELTRIKARFDDTVPGMDLSQTCLGMKLPAMGYLTRIEALHFTLYHTARHVHQLKKITSAINA